MTDAEIAAYWRYVQKMTLPELLAEYSKWVLQVRAIMDHYGDGDPVAEWLSVAGVKLAICVYVLAKLK